LNFMRYQPGLARRLSSMPLGTKHYNHKR
jgi:hypothetical protein